jgi:hypothetical protein
MGVMVFVCDGAMEPVLPSVAERVVLKVGVWNVSLRRMRWCTMW